MEGDRRMRANPTSRVHSDPPAGLASTKAQPKTFTGVSRMAMKAPGGHGGRGLPVHESAEASSEGGAHGTCEVTERAG